MIDESSIYAMFEEVKQLILEDKQRATPVPFNFDEINSIKEEVINLNNSFLESFKKVEESITQPRVVKKDVVHSINAKSLGVLIPVLFLLVFLITTLIFTYELKQVNDRLSDNDLKYRYIKMKNGIDSLNLYKLEEDFHYNRNQKVIEGMKMDIEKYEKTLKEYLQAIEQAKMKGEEIIKLKFKN